jgi:hypothetical protein
MRTFAKSFAAVAICSVALSVIAAGDAAAKKPVITIKPVLPGTKSQGITPGNGMEKAPNGGTVSAPPSPVTQAIKFTVTVIKIDRTRSLRNDTDYVDADIYGTVAVPGGGGVKSMGDVGPGTYNVNLSAQATYNGQGSRKFGYTVVNSGYDANKVEAELGKETAGTWASRIGSILFANCDGTVAAKTWTVNEGTLKIIAAGGSPLKGTDQNPGTDSPTGCGSNSLYEVSWSISAAH